MGQLHLALLGMPEVHHQLSGHNQSADNLLSDLPPVTFPTRKTLALLIYLAVEGTLQPRERITALLWPDSSSELGRTSLRKTLAYLRQALGQQADDGVDVHILAERDTLRLNSASEVSVDLWQLRAAADAARHSILTSSALRTTVSASHLRHLLKPLQQAVNLYRGDFLTGFSLIDAPDFDDWASMQREIVHHQVVLVFDRLSQLQFETGDLLNAVDSAVRWVAHDGLNEAAYRRLMQLHIASGNRSAALQSYQVCRAMLEREYNAEPEVETEELAKHIRNERPPRHSHNTLWASAGATTKDAPVERETPLIGRIFEHIQLVNVYRAIQAAAGQKSNLQIMTLEGEPGIGKTRLAHEFLRWAGVQGAHILSARALEVHGRLPYQPIAEVLRLALPSLLSRLHALIEGTEGVLTKLRLAELSRLLPELQETFPDLPTPRVANEAEARLRLFEAIARVGSELAAEKLLVIFIDDLQWADAASLEVLQYCVRRWSEMQAPILLIIALRSEEVGGNHALAEWLHSIQRDAPLTRLTLGLLTAEDTLEVVQAITSFADLPKTQHANLIDFSRRLYVETQGQPFFIIQTLRSLLEHGLLPSGPGGQWPAEAIQALPTSVRDLIQSRLMRLGANAQLCCGAAAVLGNRFEFRSLCQVSGLSQQEVLSAMEEAMARGLWREIPAEGNSAPLLYSFNHDRIRDVAYAQLSEARRRLLHHLAMEALAESAPPAELARHAALAALPDRAFPLAIEAGDAAMRLLAARDAINFYGQALQLWQTEGHWQKRQDTDGKVIWLPQLFHLYQQLGRCYQVTNQPQELRATATAMLALAQQEGEATIEVQALNRLATLQAHQQAGFNDSLNLIEQARRVAEANHDRKGLAETEWNLAQLHFYHAHTATALVHAHTALALTREIGNSELLARTLNILAYLNSVPAYWAEVVAYASEAYALYMSLNDRSMALDSLCLVARGKFGLGEPQIGIEAARSAQSLIQELDNPWGMANACMNIAAGLLEIGDYEQALHHAQKAAEITRRHDLLTMSCIVHILQGNIYRAMGRLTEGQQSHRDAKQFNDATVGHPFDAPAAMALCVDALLTGNLVEAKAWADQWLATRATSLDFSAELEFAEWMEVMLRSGEVDAATEELTAFGEHFGHNPRYRITYLRAQAVLANRQENPSAALAYLKEAHTLAADLGIIHEQRKLEGKIKAGVQIGPN